MIRLHLRGIRHMRKINDYFSEFPLGITPEILLQDRIWGGVSGNPETPPAWILTAPGPRTECSLSYKNSARLILNQECPFYICNYQLAS